MNEGFISQDYNSSGKVRDLSVDEVNVLIRLILILRKA